MENSSINKILIEKSIQDGQLEAALESLCLWVKSPALARFSDEATLLSANLSTLNLQLGQNLLSNDEYMRSRAKVALGITTILGQIPDSIADLPERRGLSDYHRFTCDRSEQSEAFGAISDVIRNKKAHFFYIFGGPYQSHEGLFSRIGFGLEGRLEDYLNPDLAVACKVLKLVLTFDVATNPDIYKKNVLKSLFAVTDIPANLHGPLLDKNLAFVCANSPPLQGLGANDFACILLSISQYDWDPAVTPVMLRWFIREFCAAEPPAASPVLLFFFAIKYEEDDETLKTQLQTLAAESTTVNALPELDMVNLRDIGRWFEKYKHLEPDTRKRQERMKTLFAQPDYYMEDVEIALKKLIDEYNGQLVRV